MVGPTEARIVQPFQTISLTTSEISGVTGGSFLSLELRSGRKIKVWAVQGTPRDTPKGEVPYPQAVAENLRWRLHLH